MTNEDTNDILSLNINYEEAAQQYLDYRRQVEALDAEYKKDKAKITADMIKLENWFTAKAQADGLESVKTPLGTAYWSTHYAASVASREALFAYCKEYDAWDLVEARASKTGVKSHIEANGEPPPGVNFSSTKVFNFRKANSKE